MDQGQRALSSSPPLRRVFWDRTATVMAWGLAAITVITVWRLSHPSAGLLALFTAVTLVYVLGFAWLILIIASIRKGRVRLPVLVAPLVIALLAGAGSTRFPAEMRFAMSRPSMDAYMQALPSPPLPLTCELAGSEFNDYDTTFRGNCPWLVGSYRIVGCKVIPGGYVFLTSHDAGLAYLPEGEPAFGLPLSFLEEPYLEPLGGSWYRIFDSW